MIVSRTPFRVSFCGGGSDLPSHYLKHGGCVLSTTINKYVYITLEETFGSESTILKYSDVEVVKGPQEIKHPIVRETLVKYGVNGVQIDSISDIPAGTGMGSSSSFTVGLINAVRAYQNLDSSKKELAEEACDVEINRLGESIGVQDQYAASYGGINFMEFHADGHIDVEPIRLSEASRRRLSHSLMLFYLGGTRSASQVLKSYSEDNADQAKKKNALADLARGLRDELKRGRVEAVGEYLDKGWELKKSMSAGISNPEIDEAYSKAKSCGALGAKLLGAGGNGFLLVYASSKFRDDVRDALSYLHEMPFDFDDEGSRIVFRD